MLRHIKEGASCVLLLKIEKKEGIEQIFAYFDGNQMREAAVMLVKKSQMMSLRLDRPKVTV